ncbi:MAG: hypothetical protein LBF15_02315 [Candidatus Peribacteria bacterium]|nr:hypothetical protein [Candidatus Peribacteria bacterium]
MNLTSIKIPVYQQRTIDLLNYIYEDSGIENIKDIYIDFNLQIDSDGDGNPKNDRDSDTMPNLSVSI